MKIEYVIWLKTSELCVTKKKKWCESGEKREKCRGVWGIGDGMQWSLGWRGYIQVRESVEKLGEVRGVWNKRIFETVE